MERQGQRVAPARQDPRAFKEQLARMEAAGVKVSKEILARLAQLERQELRAQQVSRAQPAPQARQVLREQRALLGLQGRAPQRHR